MAAPLWNSIVNRICCEKTDLKPSGEQQSVVTRFLESNSENVLYILLSISCRDDASQWQISTTTTTFSSNIDNDSFGIAVIKNNAGPIANDLLTEESLSHLFTFVESSNMSMFWDQCRILVNQWFIPQLQQLCAHFVSILLIGWFLYPFFVLLYFVVFCYFVI